MLTYLLAWAVAVGSFGLYLSAFFFPELHRKNDLILSGMGLFFALTLWIYADRLRGGLLLGETAAVVLIFWFAWQSFNYRRQLTDPKLKTDDSQAQELFQAIKSVLPGQKTETDGVPTSKIAGQISDWVSKVDFNKLKGQFQGVFQKAPLPAKKPATPTEAKVNDPGLEDFTETITTAVTETFIEPEIAPPVEFVAVEPEPTPETPVEPIAAEHDPIPESHFEPIAVQSESTPEQPIEPIAPEPEPIPEPSIETVAPEPELISESPIESVITESESQDIQADSPTPEELNPESNLEQPEQTTNSDQESGHWSNQGHDGNSDDNWPPPDPIS